MIRKFWIVLIAIALSLPLVCGQAGADVLDVEVAKGGIGDVLLGPIFDVREVQGERTEEWFNYITIENTSDKWTAVHLRFRSWRTCAEIYDHVILLSPYDVFWANIIRATEDYDGKTSVGEDIVEGDVLIKSSDTHTLLNSGLIYAVPNAPETPYDGIWTARMQDTLLRDVGFNQSTGWTDSMLKEEMQAGHIEVIGLWQLENPEAPAKDTSNLYNVVTNAYNDSHTTNNADPRWRNNSTASINVYDVMDALFYNKNGPADADKVCDATNGWCSNITANVLITGVNERGFDREIRLAEDCANVLAGSLEMGDVATGRYERENFVALKNFRTDYVAYQAAAVDAGLVGAVAVGDYHRDGYPGGPIVYPVKTMEWEVYAGIPAWYVNENWATTVGPGLRDGDNSRNEYPLVTDIAGNNYVDPFNSGGLSAAFRFNDIWSLDEVETALRKNEVWSQYYTKQGGAGADNLITDVVITFPTKHYHFFFRDWPYWSGDGFDAYDTKEAYWDAVGVEKQLSARNGYRYRGADSTPQSIARRYRDFYSYGRVGAIASVWNMEEEQKSEPLPDSGTPPPGSPWSPGYTVEQVDYILYEVNIIRVGTSETGLEDTINQASYLLPDTLTYDEGHFRLATIAMSHSDNLSNMGRSEGFANGEHDIYRRLVFNNTYTLPLIGTTIFTHTYGADTCNIIRSSMDEWHWNFR